MYYAFQRVEGGNRFVPVQGRKVEFEGFGDFEFFYYKEYKADEYQILEARTGLAVGSGEKLKYAKNLARLNLQIKGAEELKKIIEKKIKKHGISPRYEEVKQ